MTSEEDVRDFLLRFNRSVEESYLIVVPREKNLRIFTRLGLDIDDVEHFIRELSVRQYSEGPLVDDDGSEGEIWIFGMRIQMIDFYIKLKLSEDAKCLSFHAAEHLMEFPYEGIEDEDD